MNFVPNFTALNEARARAHAEQTIKEERLYQQAKETVLARLKDKEGECTQAIENHYIAYGRLPGSPETFEQCHVHMPTEITNSGMSLFRFKQEVVDHSDGGLKILKLEDCDGGYCGWNSRIGMVPRYARTK